MSRESGRSTTVDFLRRFALITIAVDHVSQSELSHLTLHTYAFCDAARFGAPSRMESLAQ
jgi:hypothetical protein